MNKRPATILIVAAVAAIVGLFWIRSGPDGDRRGQPIIVDDTNPPNAPEAPDMQSASVPTGEPRSSGSSTGQADRSVGQSDDTLTAGQKINESDKTAEKKEVTEKFSKPSEVRLPSASEPNSAPEETELAARAPQSSPPVQEEAVPPTAQTRTVDPAGERVTRPGATDDGSAPEAGPAVRGDRTPASTEETGASDGTVGDPMAPRFDVVRVDRDGQTVIAGTANPGDMVEILLDGEVVGSTRADANGAFVTVVFADLTGEAQQLQLRSTVSAAMSATAEGAGAHAGLPATETTEQQQASRTSATESETAVAAASPEASSDAEAQTAPKPAPTTTAEVGTGTEAAGPEPRVALSAPVIILPSARDDAAPTLVQPKRDTIALLQPATDEVEGVVIDTITYGDSGDVRLSGRGLPGTAIRIYGNGVTLGEVPVRPTGQWLFALARAKGEEIKLFRFDAIAPDGAVTSRIETPFEYAELSPQVMRERKVVIQKGDVLWRLAEQYYGEGIRYSVIFGANSELIRDPDLIYPGQVFTIPELVAAE